MSFYDEASWVLIPEGIKEDVVYAQKPTNGLGDLVYTRASDATRTNSAGVIERTPWNLVTWSEMFSDASWTKTNLTVGVNTINSPIGTLTADTLTENTANATHELRTNTITPPVGSINLSVYGKMKERRYLRVGLTVAWGASLGYVVFDLQTGTITYTAGAIVGTIENAGDGWYRCSVRGTVTSSVSGTAYIGINGDSTTATTYLGNVTSGIYLWGAQLVEGTDAKPYFATTNRQDVPRLDYRNADGSLNSCPRLLLEPQRTNSIRNSTMVGAVAGSPGTLPTNWLVTANAGLTQTIVGIGTENGLAYIDIRFNGTASGSLILLSSESTSGIAASNGQTWTNSFYFKTIASPLPPTSYNVHTIQRASGTNIGAFNLAFTPTTTLARYAQTVTTNQATITHIQPYFFASVTSGATYDFTIRIAAPQMELGAYATTFIPTTTAAVTRLADVAIKSGVSSLIGQTSGAIFFDYNKTVENLSMVSIDTDSNNRIFLESPGGNNLRLRVISSGTTTLNNTSTTLVSGRNKIAIAYANNDVVMYHNGLQVFSNNSATIPATENIRIGANVSNNFPLGDGVNQAAIFPTRLTNAQLAEITTL